MTIFKKDQKALNVLIIFCLAGWLITSLVGCGGSGNIPPASILSSGRITLSWDDVPGAANYDLYMATTPGMTVLNSYKISDVTSPITLTDLEPDTTYYFIVVVYSDTGESRKSEMASYTVTAQEGSINFGNLLDKSAPTDKSVTTAKGTAATATKAKTTAKKPQPQVSAASKKSAGPEIIICFGDSLTSGTGATNGMDYPSQLAGMIGKPVINRGISGDTTSRARKRLERDVLSAKPDIVLVTLGGNDLKNGVAKDIAFANLESIVKTIQQSGATVIVGGLKFPGRDRGYGKGYEDLAKQTGAILIPNIFDGVVDNPNLMSDPIHPNNAGYRIIAQRFSSALASVSKTDQTVSKKSGKVSTKKKSLAAISRDKPKKDVTLAWDDVPGANSYVIYWRDKPGVTKQNGTRIANATNPYTLKNLIKGKKYYFIVTAVNASGESPPSAEFAFTAGGAN